MAVETLEISKEGAARFAEDGYLPINRIVDDDTVFSLRAAFDRMFRGEFATGVRPDEVNWQKGTGDPTLTRQICNGWRSDPAIARVVLREDLGRAVATLADWPGARIMQDNILWKPPGARPLGFHQDSAYLSWFDPSDLMSVWVALDDTSAEGGTVEFAPGSHKWAQRKPEGEFHGPKDYRKFMECAAAADGAAPNVAPLVVKAGGGSIHHGWVWHGSGVNRSDRPRRALVLHAMSSEAQYAPERLGAGTGPIYSRYKRLNDNRMNANYFPVLWTRDGRRTPGLDDYLAKT